MGFECGDLGREPEASVKRVETQMSGRALGPAGATHSCAATVDCSSPGYITVAIERAESLGAILLHSQPAGRAHPVVRNCP